MNMPRFQHRVLLDDEIRLCRVARHRSPEGLLQLELVHCRCLPITKPVVDGQSTASEYTALSYTWGPVTPSYTITINEAPFTVRENLNLFLESTYKLEEFDTWFWIDQLCIDQANVEERNAIVQRMGSIYSNARGVRIWLGERNELTDAAFATIRDLQLVLLERGLGVGEVLFKEDGIANCCNILTDMLAVRSTWPAAMHELMSRPYWSRLWIRQEIRLAKRTCLQCGTRCFSSADLMDDDDVQFPDLVEEDFRLMMQAVAKAWALFDEVPDPPAARLFDTTWSSGSTNHNEHHLFNAFQRYAGDCQDPRDVIFAILALVLPEQRVVVDYDMTAEEVFWAAVEKMYVRGLWALLDMDGVRVLLQVAHSMRLSDVVNEELLRTRVAAIYARHGWNFAPARSEEEMAKRQDEGVYEAIKPITEVSRPFSSFVNLDGDGDI